MKKIAILLLCLLLLASCGKASPVYTPPERGFLTLPLQIPPLPEPPEPPEPLPYVNPLTGEGCAEDIAQRRPYAVMLNNLKKALPQAGVAEADILYEVCAEGGITRMLGVFQSVDGVGNIGTVRSARDYYISLAAGHDALFLHAGGSPKAYEVIKSWGIAAFDCVNGPYEGTLYWRDKERRRNAGMEHSVLTSGETISALMPTYRARLEHKEGYVYPMSFAEDAAPENGQDANTVTVTFSTYKTGVFTYDAEAGMYRVEEYGQPYVDANTGEQVLVKNVLVLYTDKSIIAGDEAGRLKVRTTGTGKGWFACGGKAVEIKWSKKDVYAPLTYTTTDGKELVFGVGPSYVNLVGAKDPVTFH